MKFLTSFFILLFASSSFSSEELSVQDSKKFINKTLNNLLEADNHDEVVARKKKKRRRKRRRRKRRRRERRVKKFTRAGKMYAEFNIGMINHGTQEQSDFETQFGSVVTNYDTKDNSTGFSLAGGYFLTDWMALELSYNMLGGETVEFVITPDSYKVDRTFSTFDISGKFFWWFNRNLNIYGKPSITYWSMSAEAQSTDTSNANYNKEVSGSGFSTSLGLGGEYYFGNLYVGLGTTLYFSIGDDTLGSQGHVKMLGSVGYVF